MEVSVPFMRPYKIRKMDFAEVGLLLAKWYSVWGRHVQRRYARPFAVSQRHPVLAVGARGLEKMVERLEELELLSVLGLESLHTRIGFESGAIDPRDDGSKRRIVVHVPQPASQFHEQMNDPRSRLGFIMTENQRYNPRMSRKCRNPENDTIIVNSEGLPIRDMIRDVVVLSDGIRFWILLSPAYHMLQPMTRLQKGSIISAIEG